MGKTMEKANNSSAGRFFYSFGTVFLLAVLTICIINFSRDSRAFQKTVAAVTAETNSGSPSSVEGTIKIDTSKPKASSASPNRKQAKPAATDKTQTGGGTGKPSNPGEAP